MMKTIYIVNQKTSNFEWEESNSEVLATFSDLDLANKMVNELTAFWGDRDNKFGTYYYFWVSTERVYDSKADCQRLIDDLKEEWEDIK